MVGDLSPGLVIAERFRLIRPLGDGGMGSVWAARHLLTGRGVALKFLRRPAPPASAARRRFQQEARAAIEHPHIVRVFDLIDLDDETPVMVLELLHGRTLAAALRRQGRLSLTQAATILRQLVSAVGCAHAHGFVHRDLKPENVFLVDTPGDELVAKILDFGVAKLLADAVEWGSSEGVRTEAGTILGTVGYAAPEQVSGDDIDARADIWALGVILYECLTGSRPFSSKAWHDYVVACARERPDPRRHGAAEIPESVVALLQEMLSPDRDSRPDLRRVLEGLGEHSDVAVPSFRQAARSGDEPELPLCLPTGSDAARLPLGSVPETPPWAIPTVEVSPLPGVKGPDGLAQRGALLGRARGVAAVAGIGALFGVAGWAFTQRAPHREVLALPTMARIAAEQLPARPEPAPTAEPTASASSTAVPVRGAPKPRVAAPGPHASPLQATPTRPGTSSVALPLSQPQEPEPSPEADGQRQAQVELQPKNPGEVKLHKESPW